MVNYASQFQGIKIGGDAKAFYDMILAWVKRKGITGAYSIKTRRRVGGKIDRQIEDEQVAFRIYLSILRHGVRPHPFMFIHKLKVNQDLVTRTTKIINTPH